MPFGPTFSSENLPDSDHVTRWFIGHIEPLLENLGLPGDINVHMDALVAQDVVRCYFDDMDRYTKYSPIDHPNIYKKMGHLAFWIRKLKPITKVEPIGEELGQRINEIFALTLAMFYCKFGTENTKKLGKDPIIGDKLWHDLLFFFRYKSVSPHALTMLLNAIYSVEFSPT